MITRFRAENLGCFEEVEVTLDQFTVLIGQNASGKSTLLRGIRALAMLTRMPLTGEDGRQLSLTYSTDISDIFRDPSEILLLGVDVHSDRGEGTYEIELEIDPSDGSVLVAGERAGWSSSGGDEFEYDAEADTPFEFDAGRLGVTDSSLPRPISLPFLAHPSYVRDKEGGLELAPLFELVEAFAPFYVYRFSPRAVAQPAVPDDNMSHDGRGLVARLDRLLGEQRNDFDYIEDRMGDLFGHVDSIVIETRRRTGGKSPLKALLIETVDGRRVPAELESDGALLSLAYLLLERSQTAGFAVEEPETGAHPALLRSRLERLRSLDVQVIVTTQSPALLTEMGDVSAVRVCENGSAYEPPETGMQDVIYKRLAWTVENVQ